MTSILAIDPAWTDHEPSGVALLRKSKGKWRCVALAPSYAQFIALARGEAVDWTEKPSAGAPDVAGLVEAAHRLLGKQSVDLVTIDMPVSRDEITGRREADSAVSRGFAARGCGTHSPSAARPGPLGRDLRDAFRRLGFEVATCASPKRHAPALVEVYPHPALLALLKKDYRVKYKVSQASKYWHDKSPEERKARIVKSWRKIRDELATTIEKIDLPLPSKAKVDELTLGGLKRYEDALDALICGWIGTEYLKGRCTPYGDESAAIWIPNSEWTEVHEPTAKPPRRKVAKKAVPSSL